MKIFTSDDIRMVEEGQRHFGVSGGPFAGVQGQLYTLTLILNLNIIVTISPKLSF